MSKVVGRISPLPKFSDAKAVIEASKRLYDSPCKNYFMFPPKAPLYAIQPKPSENGVKEKPFQPKSLKQKFEEKAKQRAEKKSQQKNEPKKKIHREAAGKATSTALDLFRPWNFWPTKVKLPAKAKQIRVPPASGKVPTAPSSKAKSKKDSKAPNNLNKGKSKSLKKPRKKALPPVHFEQPRNLKKPPVPSNTFLSFSAHKVETWPVPNEVLRRKPQKTWEDIAEEKLMQDTISSVGKIRSKTILDPHSIDSLISLASTSREQRLNVPGVFFDPKSRFERTKSPKPQPENKDKNKIWPKWRNTARSVKAFKLVNPTFESRKDLKDEYFFQSIQVSAAPVVRDWEKEKLKHLGPKKSPKQLSDSNSRVASKNFGGLQPIPKAQTKNSAGPQPLTTDPKKSFGYSFEKSYGEMLKNKFRSRSTNKNTNPSK